MYSSPRGLFLMSGLARRPARLQGRIWFLIGAIFGAVRCWLWWQG
jgi:hypothetical protein